MGLVHVTGPILPQRRSTMVSCIATCHLTLAQVVRLLQRRIEVFRSITADTVVEGSTDPSARKPDSNTNDAPRLEEDGSGISKGEMLV